MAKKISVFILIALCAVSSAFATIDVSFEEVTDDWVIDFIDKYTDGTPLDEYVEMVDIVDGIFFEYDTEDEFYSVCILYSDGNTAYIEFLPYQIDMYYVEQIRIPAGMKSQTLEIMNECQSRDNDSALGTIILDNEVIGARHIILSDGVWDYGEWAYWSFYYFESYSRNTVDEVLIRLGLKTNRIW